jgi:hypothetical protein
MEILTLKTTVPTMEGMKKSFNDLIKFVIDQETYVFKENNRKQVK